MTSVTLSLQKYLDSDKDYPPSFENALRKIKDEVNEEHLPQYAFLLSQIHESNESLLAEKIPPGDLQNYLNFLRTEIQEYRETHENRILCRNPEDLDWEFPYSILNLVVPNDPFVVDSIVDWVGNTDYKVEHSIYNDVDETVFGGEADDDPSCLFLSLLLEPLDGESASKLESIVRSILGDIKAAVGDFKTMLDRLDGVEDRLSSPVYRKKESTCEIEDVREFLDYLRKDNFVFLGYAEADEEANLTDKLGLFTRSEEYNLSALPLLQEAEDEASSIFSFVKTALVSRVYRRDRLYCLTIDRYDEKGNRNGQDVFLGLFTNRVLTEPAVQLPILKQKFERLTEREGLAEHTHDYRDVYSIFNSMPKHLLFMMSVDELIEDINSILNVRGDRQFKVRARPVPHHEGLSIMIVMEKEKFSGDIRQQMQAEIEDEFEAKHVDYRLSLGEGSMARLHFDIETERLSPKSGSFEELEETLYDYTRSWGDRLRDCVFEETDDEKTRQRYLRYQSLFPENYRALVRPRLALRDVKNLEKLRTDESTAPLIDMVNFDADATHLIIYHTEKYSLNETMPILSNHGFTVVQQATFQVEPEGETYHLHLFDVQDDNEPLDLEDRKTKLVTSITEILGGTYRDDSLNELILRENIPTRVLNLFRLYKNYYHQLSPAIKLESINRTLLDNPGIAKELMEFFRVKFNPEFDDGDRSEQLDELRKNLDNGLKQIEDRTPYEILRSLMNLIDATVRTNFYQQPGDTPSPSGSDDYISVKIKCEAVDQMPEPRPLYEVFVYSSLMEAVHLRSGKIARGGIRWSNRRDDFRTEVLGLMKTQKVKNALIVPTGAKGGFVLKTEYLDNGQSLGEHAREQYAVFMHALLDLSDNYVDGELQTPPNLVTYDGEDPYLVVAADKGTATFSDTANAIADEYDFWLGDAFASGGSVGYDHKELGITARGGWECVKRHFRELGQNIQEEPFTVAGIGDMSGDVFGNGMILSDQIKLVAAFDHRDVFLDPDPDPQESFEERKRLFEREDSSWEDYGKTLISEGGGVYDRNANVVEVSEKIVDILDLEQSELPPDDLIKAILCADVDLLWNGGIGTYIKSSDESHAKVGDPQNDAFRADADEIRASVIGEGGNLGITQRGRIELDRHGVKLNTDFIDNSGGVDLSDHEVNLKILLKESIRQGLIAEDEREEILLSLADEAVEEVIYDNYEQSGVISLESRFSGERIEDYRHLIQHLEETIDLDRTVEFLPDEQELQDRMRANETMTRPELAILLSYTKMDLYNQTRRESWPDTTITDPFLERYFPETIIENHGDALETHRLRDEIALTSLVNYCVDGAGCIFFHRLEEELGVGLIRLVKSYLTADRLAGGETIRQEIFNLDNTVPARVQYNAWQSIVDNMAHTVSWLIDTINVSVISEGFQERMQSNLDENFKVVLETLQPRQSQFLNQNFERWKKMGINETLSRKLGKLPYLVPAMEIILLHQDFDGMDVRELSEFYFKLGKTLHIDWIIRKVFEQDASSRWDQFAFRTLGIELHELQRQILQKLIEGDQSLDAFKRNNRDTLQRLNEVQKTLIQEEDDRYSAFQYMAQRMRSLL